MFDVARRPAQSFEPGASAAQPGARAVRRPAAVSFPHEDQIRRATGSTLSLTSVRDDAGCAARGTPAFTDGGVTHFAGAAPSLHVAAHEAAHQMQHAGHTRDAGLGAEGHANAVADGVLSGRSVTSLFGSYGAPVSSGVRNYEEGRYGKGSRVGDQGRTLTYGNKDAYATPDLIAGAGNILKMKKSDISISAGGGGMTVEAPDKSGTYSLSKIEVTMKDDPGKKKLLYGDCRQAAKAVAGDKSPSDKAICKPGHDEEEYTTEEDPREIYAFMMYLDQEMQKEKKRVKDEKGRDMTPEEEKELIARVRKEFHEMSQKERMKLKKKLGEKHHISKERAKELGIDENVQPQVGDSFVTMRSDYKIGEYNFHYATVIMVAGSDQVTLENAGGDPDQKTEKWYMQTYGSAKEDQSFHSQWRGKFGDNPHTFLVRGSPPVPKGAENIPAQSTPDLIKRYRASTDETEKYYIRIVLEGRSVSVTVNVIAAQEGEDNVMVDIGGVAGNAGNGSTADLSAGQTGTFGWKASSFLSMSDPFTITVTEYDTFSNDTIATLSWPSPYAVLSRYVAGDGAAYFVEASM